METPQLSKRGRKKEMNINSSIQECTGRHEYVYGDMVGFSTKRLKNKAK